MHKSGFVNILGRPNTGKSTLMNALLGERLSIVSPKAQTTRHRIIGLLNDDAYQIVFSDTPGIILDPKYKLHHKMMRFVETAFQDADVLLFLADVFEKSADLKGILAGAEKLKIPKALILNKIDLIKEEELQNKIKEWQQENIFDEIISVSALKKTNVDGLLEYILKRLPEHPPYYPKEELTDRNVRYFVSEIIREKIFNNYRQEIPYSCEVAVTTYEESTDIDRMRAEIFVERDSQKAILIGDKGSSLKKVGMEARKDIEELIGKKVYLELFVKVKDNWKDDERLLKSFGYE
ncbi:MAG: GTPase Era [Chitinophagales bacterium]|nr:GTPase Era [Chitinophagales bacterium]